MRRDWEYLNILFVLSSHTKNSHLYKSPSCRFTGGGRGTTYTTMPCLEMEKYLGVITKINGLNNFWCNSSSLYGNKILDFSIIEYEQTFRKLAYGDRLLKSDLHHFFTACDLHPTEGEIQQAFEKVFKGVTS